MALINGRRKGRGAIFPLELYEISLNGCSGLMLELTNNRGKILYHRENRTFRLINQVTGGNNHGQSAGGAYRKRKLPIKEMTGEHGAVPFRVVKPHKRGIPSENLTCEHPAGKFDFSHKIYIIPMDRQSLLIYPVRSDTNTPELMLVVISNIKNTYLHRNTGNKNIVSGICKSRNSFSLGRYAMVSFQPLSDCRARPVGSGAILGNDEKAEQIGDVVKFRDVRAAGGRYLLPCS